MYYDLLAEAKLAWESFQWFRDSHERVGGESGFTKTGFLWIEPWTSPTSVRANSAAHRAIGVDSSFLGADEIRDRAPAIVVGDEVAAWEPESGYADPSMTATSFLAAARDRGGAPADRRGGHGHPDRERPRDRRPDLTPGDISAPVVVDAAGALGGRGGGARGAWTCPVEVWRHDTGYLGLPAAVARPIPVVIDNSQGMYFRPEGADLLLVGLEDGSEMGGSPDRETVTARAGLPRHGRRAAGPAGAGPRRRDLPDGTRRAGRPVTGPARGTWAPRGPTASTSTAATAAPASRPPPPWASGWQSSSSMGPRPPSTSARSTQDGSRAGRPLVGEHGEALIWR